MLNCLRHLLKKMKEIEKRFMRREKYKSIQGWAKPEAGEAPALGAAMESVQLGWGGHLLPKASAPARQTRQPTGVTDA